MTETYKYLQVIFCNFILIFDISFVRLEDDKNKLNDQIRTGVGKALVNSD